MKTESIKLVDLNFLQITCSNSEDLIKRMIYLFLDSAPKLILDMKKNLMNQNWEILNNKAHEAKSAFLVIGAVQTASKIEEIELGTINPSQTDMKRLLNEILHESDSIFDELRSTLIAA